MTTVKIDPGICGLITTVEAFSEDGVEVTLKVISACQAIKKMFEHAPATFDAYELCLTKPGTGTLYELAQTYLPGHASCSAIAGIIKAAEVECKLALPKTATIEFLEK